MNDVFAVDVETGKILWQYKAKLNQKITTVCCGWLNRGVAIGDGRVYQGQLDGNVVRWMRRRGSCGSASSSAWQAGQTITAAPIYADGRIYLGVVGADLGRGFLEAMDAETGESVWRYYDPGPGENPGGDSWPKDSDAYLRGGGAIWQAPAYDPDLGLLYFSTGNAGPDWDGSVREGDNKWTVSIVAVEAETGTFRWGYQMVHHDIWISTLRARWCCSTPRTTARRRAGGQDRLALHAGPRDRLTSTGSTRARAAGSAPAHCRDAANPAERRVHPARARPAE